MTPVRTRPWLPVLAAVLLALRALAADGREATLLDLGGPIGPASAAYVQDALDTAGRAGAAVLILRMDTPGGLDSSMRAIVKAIAASPVPVIGYVAPAGARAASAGTYILYACHLAAMAPGTNLGAATPVQIGAGGPRPAPASPTPGVGEGATDEGKPPASGPDGGAGDAARPRQTPAGDAMTHKLVNDASAYLRSLAELRGRNADWAEQAVREGASLSAEAAHRLGVVDLVARDLGDLLAQANGRTVATAAGERRLDTAGLSIVARAPDWTNRVLAVLSDPNIAYILLLLGFYGLIYELANPGAVLPGTLGALCLLLALYSFQLLPVSWAGLALLGLGLGLIVAEAFVPSFGALGLGGAAAFVIGSLMLIDSDAPGFQVSLPLIAGFALLSVLLLAVVLGLAVKAHRRPVSSGGEELLGAQGTALSGFPGSGAVRLHGEVWSARSTQSIPPGASVRVLGRDGLTLSVSPLSTGPSPAPPLADHHGG